MTIKPNGKLILICTNCLGTLHPKFYLRRQPRHGIHFNVRCYPCVRMHQASNKHNKDKMRLAKPNDSPEVAATKMIAFELKSLDVEEEALAQYVQDLCSVGYTVSPHERQHCKSFTGVELFQRTDLHQYGDGSSSTLTIFRLPASGSSIVALLRASTSVCSNAASSLRSPWTWKRRERRKTLPQVLFIRYTRLCAATQSMPCCKRPLVSSCTSFHLSII